VQSGVEAEHTVALLLALSRKIVPSVERTRAGAYEYKGLSGWDLQGKTLGVIGTGKIGSLVAKTATALGMKILAYDPKPNNQLADQLGFSYVSLEELLPKADVITLHVPLTPESKHMLGEKEFAQMKRGVVIINSARGGLIDAGALVEALENGQVAEAGLDVLEDEGLLKEEKQFFSPFFKLQDYQTAMADHALMRHPRVLVTPHNAFNSKEALRN
jgi:D-lactate dehydrogenase